MKILRIIYDWPPPWDGLAAAPYEMTSAQAEMGHDVEIFCGRWPRSGSIESLDNVTLHPFIREPVYGTISLTTSVLVFFYYLFWRLKNKPDVIHSHGHFAIWIYRYRKFLKKVFPKSKELEIPLVVHFHNTVKGREESLKEDGKQVKFISKNLAWPLAERSDKWAIETANAYIFVSEDVKKEAIKYYDAVPEKCYIVETGVNTELFRPIDPEEKIETRKDLGLSPADKVILNHGVMVERKNIHLLIESFKFLPKNYKLFLVGPVPDVDYNYELNKLIEESALDERVIRVGYTPYPQVPIAFQASDLFVLPSNWEGLPKVVMQSLACGVPVLASGFQAQNELDGLVYIDKLDPEMIAKQIMDTTQQNIHVDLSKIRALYSWRVMAKKVDKIYDIVTGHGNEN